MQFLVKNIVTYPNFKTSMILLLFFIFSLLCASLRREQASPRNYYYFFLFAHLGSKGLSAQPSAALYLIGYVV